jgi:hypothetical protein
MQIIDLHSKKPLATPALARLLKSLGSPETSSENKTLTHFLKFFDKIENPSPELSANVNALCAKVLDTADAIHHSTLALATELTKLHLAALGFETSTLNTATQVEKYAAAWSKTFHQLEREFTPALKRARKLLFLALEEVTKRISASLNGTQK